MDLCSANTLTLVGVMPSSTIVRPIAPCTTISAAINQWNACATLPQRVSVLRSMVRVLLQGGFVLLLCILVQDCLDLQPHFHFRADRLRERGHAELRAIEIRRCGEPGQRLHAGKNCRTDAVERDREINFATYTAQGQHSAQYE